MFQQGPAKIAVAKAEAVLIQIELEAGFGQAVIGTQNKRFGIADYNM